MAKYADALRWIAFNDEPNIVDVSVIAEQMSVLMVADLWRKNAHIIAIDIAHIRSLPDNRKWSYRPQYNPTVP